MKRWILFVMGLLLVACRSENNSAESGKLQVVATYSILGDIVQNVGGETITLATLVGPGGDAHTFEPTPADSKKLVEAHIIFENGLEFETWLDDLYESSGSDAKRVVVSEGIEPLAMAEEGHEEHEDEEHEEENHEGEEHEGEDHEHGEFDPHIWHTVPNVVIMVENVTEALKTADPDHADTYEANAQTYLTQLNELHTWIQAEVNKLPAEQRKLVTSHDTFGYFAATYGFEVVGTALGSVSTEVADPAAGAIVELVEQIKAVGVSAIFAENVSNPALMEQIANEAGVTLAATLYTDALGEPGSAGDTYLKMMRSNVTTMVTALGQ